ncbi:phage tail tape measure protein [Arcobacter lacus]|uniref:phage tail tape measure protein n=1 Tax=Arcobacter lacus TaxID=1912876 RepID=UPI0021BBAE9C|nr:phage tail tape measure protein [Arcobacter lacus]MCT7908796.1 phage tail tape measure protein [Arcobacter lacus]
MAVTELVNKISFVGSLQPLERLNAGLSTSIKAIGLSSVAYGTMAVALNSWVDKTTEAIYQTTNLSKELGVNVESMQQWEYVAKMNGSTADALQSSIGGLSERIGEYAKFDSGEGKEVFEKLGISVKDAEGKIKSADVVMQDLAKSMQGLNVSEQRSIVAKLGIDESMLQTLRLTDTQINHLKDSASAWGLVTEEQAEELTKYKRSLTDLGYGFDAVKTQLAIALAPTLEESIDSFKTLFKNNRELISNGLNKTVEIIFSFGNALFNTGKLIYNMIDYTVGFNNILMLLGATILWVNRAMFLNPLGILIGSVILAIGVIDDLIVAFEGGESVIADFFASFNIDIVKALTGAFSVLKGTWNGVIATGLALSEGLVAIFALLERGAKFVNKDADFGINDLYEKIKKVREEYQGLSEDQIKGAFKDGVKIDENKPLGSTIEDSPHPLNYNDLGNVHPAPNVPITSDNAEKIQLPKLNDNAEKIQLPKLNDNALLPNNIANNTNTATTNNNTQNNNINIDIKTNDAKLAGQTVVDSLNKQISNANKQFDVGGR